MHGQPVVTIREILFPTDLSPESDKAFEHVRLLSERFGASVTLYHVAEIPDHQYAHWAFAHGHEIWDHTEKVARECLERRAKCLKVSHREIVERKSSAPRGVLEIIRTLQPDLVIMATHGREGLAHALLGSVTERVVQRAFRHVLCVREPAHGVPLAYKRILVPTDFSLASRSAFPIAGLLARTFGAEIIGLHVTPQTTLATLSGIPALEPLASPPSEADLWSFLRPDLADISVVAQVHRGTVWERICHVAGLEKADLIVMSTRGHHSLADRIVGSNSERVVRHAPCPVVVA
jgi:nucleotide-binding universal stress UspA family protein